MTSPHLAELESAARFLKTELNQALNAVLAEDYASLESCLRRAALSAGLKRIQQGNIQRESR